MFRFIEILKKGTDNILLNALIALAIGFVVLAGLGTLMQWNNSGRAFIAGIVVAVLLFLKYNRNSKKEI